MDGDWLARRDRQFVLLGDIEGEGVMKGYMMMCGGGGGGGGGDGENR